ncbi:expressed unknown protein [Seminavis robusta]|uniref:Uncharacterized protein n=1 Tax=Seminavis robusta TaxID=568900 RepID=A0A9N8E5X4_9STRA|nr:expressed unknown protein [Seminavis robusta]|eukprot:Sro549_g164550.1 n/a (394) ;mRNA; r:18851-20032
MAPPTTRGRHLLTSVYNSLSTSNLLGSSSHHVSKRDDDTMKNDDDTFADDCSMDVSPPASVEFSSNVVPLTISKGSNHGSVVDEDLDDDEDHDDMSATQRGTNARLSSEIDDAQPALRSSMLGLLGRLSVRNMNDATTAPMVDQSEPVQPTWLKSQLVAAMDDTPDHHRRKSDMIDGSCHSTSWAPSNVNRRTGFGGWGRSNTMSPKRPSRVRKLPPRNPTSSTVASQRSELSWEEEREELQEKVEALEAKLNSKKAALQSLMIEKASRGSVVATAPAVESHDQMMKQLIVKDEEIAKLEETVKAQAIRIEDMEADQDQKAQSQAQLILDEWQEDEEDESLLEQLQEQNHTIARLEAEKECQQLEHQRRERELMDLVRKLQGEKAQWQGEASA